MEETERKARKEKGLVKGEISGKPKPIVSIPFSITTSFSEPNPGSQRPKILSGKRETEACMVPDIPRWDCFSSSLFNLRPNVSILTQPNDYCGEYDVDQRIPV